MSRTLTLLLPGLLAIAQVQAGEAQQGGAALDGVYLAWRTTTPMSTPEQEYLTFYPDGRVFHDDPDEGMAPPMDWSRVCRSTQCGEYRVGSNTVVIRWSSGAEQRFQVEP